MLLLNIKVSFHADEIQFYIHRTYTNAHHAFESL